VCRRPMKLLRQALDWRNPRSLWHRPVCQCLATAVCVPIAVVAFFALLIVALVWAVHFVLVALVPFLLLPAIKLGLDDSNETLRQMVENTASEGARFVPWPMLAQIDWVLLMLIPVGVSLYYQWQARWSAAGSVLVAPLLLLPLAPTCIAFVLPLIVSFVLTGPIPVGLLLDIFGWLATGQLDQAGLTGTLRTVAPLVYEHTAPFYHLVAALGVLLGSAAGLCFCVLLLIVTPLWALASQCKQDVQETLHEIDV
jgi:hypothetical protein